MDPFYAFYMLRRLPSAELTAGELSRLLCILFLRPVFFLYTFASFFGG